MNTRLAAWGLVLVAALPLGAAGGPVAAVTWSPHRAHVGCRMNMGPTGAQAWLRGIQFEVVEVDAGSPADGLLLPGDLVVGAGGVTFSDAGDSRMILGDAIGRAEAADGRLKLSIRRSGRRQSVTVPLHVTGPFAAGWPFACAKSQRILNDACRHLREAQLPNGTLTTDGGMGTFFGGLLFLASGEARYLDGARRAAYATARMDFETMDTANWALGYGGLLLAEYHLATGDTNVLAKLQQIVQILERGQMQCGSWGHSSPSAVYGAMNQAGIVCAIAISLARECGLAVDGQSLSRAMRFYGRYAELGAVPYGDHMPNVETPDDNGKSASTAILCGLHPEWRAAADVFSQSVAMGYWMREQGHTGGFFSMTWGPLAADRAGAAAFRAFMDYQAWHYNLSRTWRGGLVHLPYYEALTRFDDSSYTEFGSEFTTGGMALIFALPHRTLRILGAPAGIRGSARAAAMAEDSAACTIQEITNALAEGDPYRASEQFQSLRRLLGDADPRIAALAPRFEDGAVKWQVGAGGRYYEALSTTRSFCFQSWLPYAQRARKHFFEVPQLRPTLWVTVAPTSPEPVPSWTQDASGGVAGTVPFSLASTDFADLRLQVRSPRNAHTKVMLNGTRVAEITRGLRSGYARIPLDAGAITLLREGTNTLTITSTSVGSGGNALDVGLDGVRREQPAPVSPPRQTPDPAFRMPDVLAAALAGAEKKSRAMPLVRPDAPAVPERLRVRDAHDRFRAALDAICDDFDNDSMAAALAAPVPYWRRLASQALARRGAGCREIVVAGLADLDWRVRSASCDVLALMAPAAKSGETRHPFAADPAVVTQLVALVGDGNAWVRCRAAQALGGVAPADQAAALALARLAGDGEDWARAAALGAIDRVSRDPQLIVQAAADALAIPSSAYGVAGSALRLIRGQPGNAALVPALVAAVEHPGEGMGSAQINDLMRKLVELDPEGRRAVAVLSTVATGGYAYDRLQGNPRKTAIELLAGYGSKASAAAAALESIAADETPRNAAYREPAAAAVSKIRGR